MAYVYRHIRLDKNEVFYIGIGVGHRANQKSRRNPHWVRIVKKAGYRIEIMIDDLTWEQACGKEVEFISLYGRRDKKMGTLVNMTDGGEGMCGYVASEETRRKISAAKKGINPRPAGWKMPQHGIEKMRLAHKGHKRGVGRILSEVSKDKIRRAAINQANASGCRIPVVWLNKHRVIIREFSSVKEAARETKNFPQTIMGSIKRNPKRPFGNYWMTKTDYNSLPEHQKIKV